jgi:hypothetical protein
MCVCVGGAGEPAEGTTVASTQKHATGKYKRTRTSRGEGGVSPSFAKSENRPAASFFHESLIFRFFVGLSVLCSVLRSLWFFVWFFVRI